MLFIVSFKGKKWKITLQQTVIKIPAVGLIMLEFRCSDINNFYVCYLYCIDKSLTCIRFESCKRQRDHGGASESRSVLYADTSSKPLQMCQYQSEKNKNGNGPSLAFICRTFILEEKSTIRTSHWSRINFYGVVGRTKNRANKVSIISAYHRFNLLGCQIITWHSSYVNWRSLRVECIWAGCSSSASN